MFWLWTQPVLSQTRYVPIYSIPHDIQTMHELWGVTTYRKQNKYLSSACLMDLVAALPDSDDKSELLETQQRLLDAYDQLADQYHKEKTSNPDNSLVLGWKEIVTKNKPWWIVVEKTE